ncbi:hypothetical protein GGR58DRAFT_513142 [Xylaria digitata]|nr:hypothetical protein GGR58DRAFT_513142 [Xylaria digitata]
MRRNVLPLVLCLGGTLAQGQTTTTSTTRLQSAGFNSTFTLSKAQIDAAGLSESTAADIENIVRFDRSQLANGGPAEDELVLHPSGCVLLKAQEHTDTSAFALPPNTALSRILYTTTDLNGTVLPASAFVLWPFRPRNESSKEEAKVPVVLWSHGTSGFFASHAPSTHRALWYRHTAPFALAQEGYAVVAPDYAGLGVGVSFDGTPIPHQYLASRVGARDALYALRAAHAAFPGLLADEFVSFGHSQGGGVAWGVAEVLAEGTQSETGEEEGDEFADLRPGFRGAVAANPTTDLFTGVPEFIVPWLSLFTPRIFPSFNAREWLTPLGLARAALLREIEGGISVSQALFLDSSAEGDIIRASYNETWYADTYAVLANVGSRPFVGPLLVVQGAADVYVPFDVTAKTVRDTCATLRERGEGTDLGFLVVNGTGHVPTLDSSRPLWLEWISARFEGKAVERPGCVTTHLDSFLPPDRYVAAGNSYLQWAGAPEYSFETPLGR